MKSSQNMEFEQGKSCSINSAQLRSSWQSTCGIVGIKEAISRILKFGDRDGTRLPLCGGIPGVIRNGRIGGRLLLS